MQRQEDASVTLCSIGPLNNLADFLADEACRALIEKKVVRLISMAGSFTQGARAEWNVEMDTPAAKKVVAEWPSEIIFCPWECGGSVLTGMCYRGRENDHPAACAYFYWTKGGMARPSWDLLTVLHAIRENNGLLKTSPWGRIELDERGVSTFSEEKGGKHAYTINTASDEEISEALEKMLGSK